MHIFDNTEWNTLKESYKRLPYLNDIRFIIITGDLHQYKETYEKTKVFLNNLLDLFNLTQKDIFTVPGNHDAGDCSSKEAITHFIEHEIDKDQDCYRKYFVKGKLIDCFDDYNQFIESFYGSYAKTMYPNPEQVTVKLIDAVLLAPRHEEQAYNSCNGILHIYKKQFRLLLEDIAKMCVESNACRYSYFKKLLKNMQNNHLVSTTSSLLEHSNLRGKGEYR